MLRRARVPAGVPGCSADRLGFLGTAPVCHTVPRTQKRQSTDSEIPSPTPPCCPIHSPSPSYGSSSLLQAFFLVSSIALVIICTAGSEDSLCLLWVEENWWKKEASTPVFGARLSDLRRRLSLLLGFGSRETSPTHAASQGPFNHTLFTTTSIGAATAHPEHVEPTLHLSASLSSSTAPLLE